MMRLALCIGEEHDLRLVALAVLICVIGSAATGQLFQRVKSAAGGVRAGWLMLASVGIGTMVWSTHFVAMMGFRAKVPVTLDPGLTLVSLLVVIGLAVPGLIVAKKAARGAGFAGGAIIGVGIAAMHYLGMAAYRVDGIVTWDWTYVCASVLLSITLTGAAFHLMGATSAKARMAGPGILALGVALLHFTGMAAMSIAVLDFGGNGLSDLTHTLLAVTTSVGALLVVGCAGVSALIDGQTQNDAYRRLRRMALHDGLTDLPNRMAFIEELNRRFTIEGGAPCMAVVMLDLSRFKAVNDTYGHQAGDQLLIALSARFTAMLRTGEYIARLSGDEFSAVISFNERDELTSFLERLQAAFAMPFVFERFSASISANIGVALAVHDGFDANTLLGKADLAMYRAKSAHSGTPCFYDARMDDAVRSRRDLANDLYDAVQVGAFELHYQVQASIPTGEITGYEALVRWRHPTLGLVSPATFIPLAEEAGQIVPLSIWILRQACFEAALWPNRHVVSVNLSPLHLADPSLVETVQTALIDTGLPPERLQLELTESAIIHDRRYALGQLKALKALGISIALDDFGVGYSSIDVLRAFAFDRIKLDASFVAEIERDEQAVSILRSVAALGATLHMPILAEGVEQPGQLAIVAREGCIAIQGYLIGKPSRALADPEQVRRLMTLRPQAVGADWHVA